MSYWSDVVFACFHSRCGNPPHCRKLPTCLSLMCLFYINKNQTNSSRSTVLQDQYDRMLKTAELRTHEVTPQAELDANKDKNRDHAALPGMFQPFKCFSGTRKCL